MPGIAQTKYAASKNILIGGVARTYAYQTYDPRVVSSILNGGNVVNMPLKPTNGFTKQRSNGFGASEITDITRYNRTGFVRTVDSFVTAEIQYFQSGDSTTPASGVIVDPSIVESVFSVQDISYGMGDYVANIQTLQNYIVACMRAVFAKSLDNFLPSIYADIRIKKSYDNNPESGQSLTFLADTINATATQTTDLSDLSGSYTELADLGASLMSELKSMIDPIVENNPHHTPRICVPSSVFKKYKIVLEAYKGVYSARRRVDDVESSGTLDFVQRIMLDIDGIVIVKFPDSAVPKQTTSWRCLALTPESVCHVVNSVPIVGSTDVNIGVGGYAPSSIEDIKENLDMFYDALGSDATTNFRSLLNIKGSDRDVINNLMMQNIGPNAIYNCVRNTIERLPMGTGTEAKHYYINSILGEGTLRMNPYMMREWQIPEALIDGAPPIPFAARAKIKTDTPVE